MLSLDTSPIPVAAPELALARVHPRRFRSWHDAVAALEARLPRHVRVLSFDVFDTVVFRRLHPDLIVTGTARELERRLTQLGITPVRLAAPARGLAFEQIAVDVQARGGDFEAPLAETVTRWIELVAGVPVPDADRLAREIEEFEVGNELTAALPNTVILRWIERERSKGRRIVFCSDMYLSARQLRRILGSIGCVHLFDAGYVSSEVGLTKRTGRLFTHVLQQECLATSELFHVGDSAEADRDGAARAGCPGIAVHDRDGRRQAAIAVCDRDQYHQQPHWAGVVVAGYADRDSQPRSALEAFGHGMLGPIFAAFAHKVAELCRDCNVRHVYFLAREGLVLKAAFEHMRPVVWPESDGPPSSYLCVSRLTTLLAATRHVGLSEVSALLTNHPFATVRRLLSPFGVPDDVMRQAAERNGLADIDARLPESFRDWPPLLGVLYDPEITWRVRVAARKARRCLGEYLAQECFFQGGCVALVDVGWSGLMQESLRRAFGGRSGFPEMVGMYSGINAMGRARQSAGIRLTAVLGQAHSAAWQSGAVVMFPPGLETLLRPPHGTTIGYERNASGRLAPVFRNGGGRDTERMDDQRLVVMQAGLLTYAERYAHCVRILHATADETLAYARTCLDRLMRYPSRDEARWIFALTSVCDLGMEEERRLGLDPSTLPVVRRLRGLRESLRRSMWPHGTVMLGGGRILRHAWVTWWAVKGSAQASSSDFPMFAREDSAAITFRVSPPPTGHHTPDQEVERLAWREWHRTLNDAKARNAWAATSVSGNPFGLEYTVLQPFERRLVNTFRSLLKRPRYIPDGVSHAMLLRRAAAHSPLGRRLIDTMIRIGVQVVASVDSRADKPASR